jgi:hypothetical protein
MIAKNVSVNIRVDCYFKMYEVIKKLDYNVKITIDSIIWRPVSNMLWSGATIKIGLNDSYFNLKLFQNNYLQQYKDNL